MNLSAAIKEIIVTQLSVDEHEVVANAHLQDDLGADSLALLNLAETIANKYGITIQADELVEVENVNELIQLVESKVSSK